MKNENFRKKMVDMDAEDLISFVSNAKLKTYNISLQSFSDGMPGHEHRCLCYECKRA